MRANETTRLPRRHIFLDTEALRRRTRTFEDQQWRCGHAIFYQARKGAKGREYEHAYSDAVQLWTDIDNFTTEKARTILWTHNVGYDLRVSDGLRHLARRGWELESHNLGTRSTWLVWRNSGRSLVVADSTAVFGTTLAQMGKWFGMEKPTLPDDMASTEAWAERCRVDTHILKRAVLSYLEWLETADMGNWQMTGAGQSYAAFRHRFLTDRMEVHDHAGALAAERRALWCGRTEALWHGVSKHGVLYEYDFHCSYARLAASHPVPIRFVGEMPKGYDWQGRMARPDVAFLAQVTVECETPLVPTERDGRIIWPVGRFRTTLWDPEINALIRAGATIHVETGWLYRAAPALAGWAAWILDSLAADDQTVPAWQKHVLKAWSRALIGRFAMTYTDWEPFGALRRPDAVRWTSVDAKTGETADMIQVGNKVWREEGKRDWTHSMPMITGYIQSLARVQLWDIVTQLGPGVVRYLDTDSVMVDARDIGTAQQRVLDSWAPALRLKHVWDGYAIHGPRQVVTGQSVRFSGLPYNARETAPLQYDGAVWESLAVALSKRRPDLVRVTDRRWRMRGVDRRRMEGEHGWTVPYRIEGEQ